MTPEYLAEALVNHFKPSGKILEPCKGTGNFLKFLPKDSLWCEISEGKNFFDFNEKVNWIITNPPWSQIRKFLQHSMEISKNVCFLFTINHLWTKARIRDIKEAGFGIREIVIFDTPDNFPPLGFQVGMIHLQAKYSGDIIFSDLSGLIETQATPKELSFNMRDEENLCDFPKLKSKISTSHHANIKRNFGFSPISEVKHKNGNQTKTPSFR
jgi:hypothetical protein